MRAKELYQRAVRWLLAVLAGMVLAAGCSGNPNQRQTDNILEIRPGILEGYLKPEALPNSAALLPPPPAAGSAADELDLTISRKSLAYKGTSRWELATLDANLMFPRAAESFSCALGIPITKKHTPHLYMLLRRTLSDAGFSTYHAKSQYQRKRPFAVNYEPICTPDEEEFLLTNGSYPSGHTAIGWAWALILSEIAPGRADAVLARGRAFGKSRIICNVHWYSDVAEGRIMGAAAVARLHADSAFKADLEAAKDEVAAARARGLRPRRDCEAEAKALAQDPF
jgi:acid phosphatase (class A)